MRVHGDVKISRRNNILSKAKYSDYLGELKEDFSHICGYCGKSESVTKNAFEIDHFIPRSLAPELEHEYINLVYSCFTCNRKKGKKWPTQNTALHNNGLVGFSDPATEDYDLHLVRSETGNIQPLTEVGKYMCNSVFKFHLRPIKEIWICENIIKRQEQLENMISKMTAEESKEYIAINKQLKELMQLLFTRKE